VYLWLGVAVASVGGVLLGAELAKLVPWRRSRPSVAVLQVVAVAIVATPALLYGRAVAPGYFDLGMVLRWYWAAIAVGAVLIAVQHGCGVVRDRVRAGR